MAKTLHMHINLWGKYWITRNQRLKSEIQIKVLISKLPEFLYITYSALSIYFSNHKKVLWETKVQNKAPKASLLQQAYVGNLVKHWRYLNNKLECTRHIGIAADNNHNVDITNSHVKERAAPNLSYRTRAKLLCLHNMHSESIHHVSSD